MAKHIQAPLYARTIRRAKGDYAEVRTVNAAGIGLHIARFDSGDAGMDAANAALFAEAATLKTEVDRLHRLLWELCKDEADDPSVGITGWSEYHDAIRSAKQLLARINNG